MIADSESIARYWGIDHDDLVVLEPMPKPARHIPEVIRQRGGLFLFGRSLGATGMIRYPILPGVN